MLTTLKKRESTERNFAAIRNCIMLNIIMLNMLIIYIVIIKNVYHKNKNNGRVREYTLKYIVKSKVKSKKSTSGSEMAGTT